MKYRKYKKKLRKNIVLKINKLSPKPNEIVALYYPYGEVPYDQLYKEFKYISHIFKNNKVIALPDVTKIAVRDDEEIINVINALQKVLETR